MGIGGYVCGRSVGSKEERLRVSRRGAIGDVLLCPSLWTNKERIYNVVRKDIFQTSFHYSSSYDFIYKQGSIGISKDKKPPTIRVVNVKAKTLRPMRNIMDKGEKFMYNTGPIYEYDTIRN